MSWPRLEHSSYRAPVNGLVAADAKNGGPKNRIRVTIDHDLHETLCLALLNGTSDPCHRPLTNPHAISFGARLRLGHADTPEWRIDIQRIAGDAIAHPAALAIQQIGGHNLKVVVCGVGEGAAAVAVA